MASRANPGKGKRIKPTAGKTARAKSHPTFNDYRALSRLDKLRVLANYYGSIDALSEAMGISPQSLRATLTAIAAGKISHVLERDDYRQGMRAARHRMTDAMRRTEVRFQRGDYEAPVIRYRGGIIVPERHSIFLEQSKKVVDSFWLHYRVEHLTLNDQWEIARQLFEWAMETGQWNAFRFEYLATAQHYLESSPMGRRTFKDIGLRNQAEISQIIKLSTRIYPLPQAQGNSDVFLDDIEDIRKSLYGRGYLRIVDLAWTNIGDLQRAQTEAMAKVKRKKWVNKRGK
jgi:hypothetical protein